MRPASRIRLILSCALLLVLLGVLATSGAALEIAINPPHPTINDAVEVVLSHDCWDCSALLGHAVIPAGNTFNAVVMFYAPPGLVCPTVCVPWTVTETLGQLPAGRYVVIGHAAKSSTPAPPWSIVYTDEAMVEFDVVGAPGNLKGQVRVAGTTISIEGATVEAYLGGQLKGSATTGADGIYTIPNLPPGSYVVRASKVGYVSQDKWNILVTEAQTTFVNFNLQISGRLKGQVRDRATGAPLIGATVAARVGNALRLLATTTAPYGIYEVTSNLAPGTYVLTAAKSGYLPQVKKDIVVIAGQTTYVNFALERIPALVGQVRDRLTGLPIIGATVDAYQKAIKIASAVTVAPYGVYRFTFDELPPGTYDLIASAKGYLPQVKANITVGATATTYVNFALQPAGSGQWSVTQNGAVLEIAYGSGPNFPQYGALHLDSSYLRLTYGPDGGWGTSVILVPPFWSGGVYHQGAPIACNWEIVGVNLVLHIAGVSGGLTVVEQVVIFPPASNAIAAAVSVGVVGSVTLDVRPGEAFKPVMLSSMRISADLWDSQSAFVGSQVFPIPDSGWIISPLDAIAGSVFGLNGGTSAWKTNAPTVAIALDVPRQICGWVTPSANPNDDNVGLWAASDVTIPSYHYVIVAKSP